MGCKPGKAAVQAPAPAPAPATGVPRGKLLEFRAKGTVPGRQFSATLVMRGSESIQAAFAPRHVLPTEWKPFAVYLDTVTFRYHNDTGAMHNIIIEPQQGVRLLGQNILPTAVPVRHQQWWDAANPRWGMLRDKGHMCWQDDYVLLAPTSLSNVPQLLEFTVRGTHPDRLFSARITLVDEKGAHLCTATLLDTISLGLDDQSFRFDLSHVAFQYWNDTGRDHCIKIDPGPGVQLLGENILPSAVLVGHSWGAPSEGNPRWRWLRTDGTFAWQGRYEMIRSEIDRNDPVMSLPVELPDYWAAEAENVPSRRLPESPEVIQAVQKLLDNTWRSTVTRDRAEDQEGARATVPRMEVVQVVRNENPSLWLPYWRERERIRRRCEGKALSNETVKTDEDSSLILHHFSLMKEVREFYLFHGTRPSAANTICESDFNVDLAGSRMGTLYGRGIYFAEASSKADEYADDDKDGLYAGLYCMLICRVTMGDWIYSDSASPDVSAMMPQIRRKEKDSILGDRERARGTYREFVIFNREQVYPEYIVIYKRKAA